MPSTPSPTPSGGASSSPLEPPQERPVTTEGLPPEEGISEADAAERLDKDPDEQQNQEEL